MDSRDWLGFALVIAGGGVAASGVGTLIGGPLVVLGVLVVLFNDSDD